MTKPTREETKQKIETDPDFIYSSRYNNSLQKIIQKYPDGCSDKLIAQVLMLDNESEVEEIYQGIIKKLQEKIL